MTILHAKRTALAFVAGVAALSCVSGAALAGFDEAHMYSFMDGSDAAPVPAAPTAEARGHDAYQNDHARAYYEMRPTHHHGAMHHLRLQQ